jgi:hypothetical protein
MKRCPECRRDFYDDTLSFCLDDGTQLVDGPAADEPATELFKSPRPQPATDIITEPISVRAQPAPAASKSYRRPAYLFVLFSLLVISLGGFFAYRYFSPDKQIQSLAVMPFVNESGNADVEYLASPRR